MNALLLALAQSASLRHGGEATLVLPDLRTETVRFAFGLSGQTLLSAALLVCLVGLAFGALSFSQLRALPVHRSMAQVSELIYETCKTYLATQARYILGLEALTAVLVVAYFAGVERLPAAKVLAVLGFSALGIAGSLAVSWFGIRVNTFANSRASFASLRGRAFPVYAIPLKAGMSIGTVLISLELLVLLGIVLWVPRDYAGPCFIGFAIGESLGASALRIAGGIFTKIADIGSDLMKIVFNLDEDDARNPGVIADCAGDNAGDSVGPTADGFETYGVTLVALVTYVMLAVRDPAVQVQLLVWMFAVCAVMILASIFAYVANEAWQRGRHGDARSMDFEAPLTSLVWLTSLVSIGATFGVSYALLPTLGDGSLWWKLALIVSFGTLAGAVIPVVIKVFTSTKSRHVREVVEASREGGASLNVLAGLTAGNFSAYWMGMLFVGLMGAAYLVSLEGLEQVLDVGPAVYAFGLLAFGMLSMGPVTIAVDSYGPVTDNAQSVYELSLIEKLPGVREELEKEHGFAPDFARSKELLEENDGAGNTFKATAKPVLIGTAVVGATTMIFSIVLSLTDQLTRNLDKLSLTHPPFLLGLIAGGAVIHWFAGASTQAVATGAYRAVEYIKAHIRLEEGATSASLEDSKQVVAICTQFAQRGMTNIFLAVFCSTLAFAFVDTYLFVGYLLSLAIFGLYQALFMANAGGAWDNAKKVIETELRAKHTPLHAASVVGDTVGDPFKDTASVAMNPVIKFSTLLGLLAAPLARMLRDNDSGTAATALAGLCFAASLLFVYRSFYAMRIGSVPTAAVATAPGATVALATAGGATAEQEPLASEASVAPALATETTTQEATENEG